LSVFGRGGWEGGEQKELTSKNHQKNVASRKDFLSGKITMAPAIRYVTQKQDDNPSEING